MAELIKGDKHALVTGKALPAKNGYKISLADATSSMGLEAFEAHDALVAKVESIVADVNKLLEKKK